MANVFKTSKEIHLRFDLKGSKQGRRTRKSATDYIDSAVALKDLDFLEQPNLRLRASEDVKKALLQQIEDDVALFQRCNINDYSLLMGVHYLDEGEAEHIMRSSPNIHKIIKNSFKFKGGQSLVQKQFDLYKSTELLRPPIPFYECHDGGILSEDGKCLYFLGIIDTLTNFG